MTEITTNTSPKTCLECGEPLGAGRSDRKFCNDLCRTAHNNRRRTASPAESEIASHPDPEEIMRAQNERQIQKITDILYDNRVKLMNIFGPGDHVISLNDFYGYGVNLKYFTSEYKEASEGYVYRMAFDYGYHIQGELVYLICMPTEIYFI